MFLELDIRSGLWSFTLTWDSSFFTLVLLRTLLSRDAVFETATWPILTFPPLELEFVWDIWPLEISTWAYFCIFDPLLSTLDACVRGLAKLVVVPSSCITLTEPSSFKASMFRALATLVAYMATSESMILISPLLGDYWKSYIWSDSCKFCYPFLRKPLTIFLLMSSLLSCWKFYNKSL